MKRSRSRLKKIPEAGASQKLTGFTTLLIAMPMITIFLKKLLDLDYRSESEIKLS